jgi:hypothetical protein
MYGCATVAFGYNGGKIPHSAFRIPHSAFRIPHSAFRIPHSAPLAALSGCKHIPDSK